MLDTLAGELCFFLAGFILMPLLGSWFATMGWGFVVWRKTHPHPPLIIYILIPVIFCLWGYGCTVIFGFVIAMADRFMETNSFSAPLIMCGIGFYYWVVTVWVAIKMQSSTTFALFGVKETFKKTNMEDVLLVTMWLKYIFYSRVTLWIYTPWFKGQTFQEIMSHEQPFRT